jgi:nitrite reductase/ring-hydroxylating ferredoxin subunit
MSLSAEQTLAGQRLVRVAAVADVPAGWVLKVRVGSRELALAHTEDGLYATENACSHAGGPLGDTRVKEGCFVECPWHNSVFDVRTGAVVRGPARKELKVYDVTVQDGMVFVALPE